MDEESEDEEPVAVVGEGERSRGLDDGLDAIEGFEGGREGGKGGSRGSNSLREEEGEEEEDTALGPLPAGTADSLTKRSVSASQMVARG